MKLPVPPSSYDPQNEAAARRQIEAADDAAYKRGQDLVLAGAQRLVLPDPGGDAWSLTVGADGALGTLDADGHAGALPVVAPSDYGLFTGLGGVTIPAGVRRIQTRGYAAVGLGAAWYVETATTGAKAWRKQSADGRWWTLERDFLNIAMFGAAASLTDNYTALKAALYDFPLAEAPDGVVIYGAPGVHLVPAASGAVPVAPFVTFDGQGWSCHIKGMLELVNRSGGVGGHLTYRAKLMNFCLDGSDSSFNASIGLNVAGSGGRNGPNGFIAERIYLLGFKYQMVIDQVQDSAVRDCEWLASSFTVGGLVFPAIGELNSGNLGTTSASNVSEAVGNHFNGVANNAGYIAMIYHGGLQHTAAANQASNGKYSYQIGGGAQLTLRGQDLEFVNGGASINEAQTDLNGDTVSPATSLPWAAAGMLHAENLYIDKPITFRGCFLVVLIGNKFSLGGTAIAGGATVSSAISIGNQNASGTSWRSLWDAAPREAFLQQDRESFLDNDVGKTYRLAGDNAAGSTAFFFATGTAFDVSIGDWLNMTDSAAPSHIFASAVTNVSGDTVTVANANAWGFPKATTTIRRGSGLGVGVTTNIFNAKGLNLTPPVIIPAEVEAKAIPQFLSNPANGATYTINGKVYTFQTTLTNLDGHVQIGATLTDTRTGLRNAINLDGVAGVEYALATTANPYVSAANSSTDKIVLAALVGGSAGDAITLASSSGAISTPATLSNGTKGVLTLADANGALRAQAGDSLVEFFQLNFAAGILRIGNTNTSGNGAGLTGPRLSGANYPPGAAIGNAGLTDPVLARTNGMIFFQALDSLTTYNAEPAIYLDINGAWYPMETKLRRYTAASLPAATSAMKGRQVVITDRSPPAWVGPPTNIGRVAIVAEDNSWRWVDDMTASAP